MIFTTLHPEGIAVIQPGAERLTAANAVAFKAEVAAVVDQGSTRLIMDFGAVGFIDSSALGALVGILKKIGTRGEVAVCGLSGDVAQMFRLTRMDRVFTAFPSAAMAFQSMANAP